MKNNLKEIEFIVDRLGQKIFVDDVVLYPKMVFRSPKMTLAKVISIKERVGGNLFESDYSIRIAVIHADGPYSMRAEYPEAIAYLGTYNASITQHADNLIKVDPSALNGVERCILLQGEQLVIERWNHSNERKFKIVNNKYVIYTDEDIIRASNYDWRLS